MEWSSRKIPPISVVVFRCSEDVEEFSLGHLASFAKPSRILFSMSEDVFHMSSRICFFSSRE